LFSDNALEHVMTHAILGRATLIAALATGFASAAFAQGAAGTVPQVYGSARAASRQAAPIAETRTAEPAPAAAASKPGDDIRVSSRTMRGE
jgi:predicted flap endonuclease-1-like 5' DNA nuclease